MLTALLLSFFAFIVGFPGGSVVKNLPANSRDARDVGSIPGLGRYPGGGGGWQPAPVSCLGKPMDRGTRGLQSVRLHRIRQDLVTKQYLSFVFFFSLTYLHKTVNIL